MRSSAWLGSVFALASFTTACSFGGSGGAGANDRCSFTFSELCDLKLDKPKTYSKAMTVIDTSKNGSCTQVIAADVASGSPALCVISGSTITIDAGATVRGIGSRPLVFAASGAISIRGTLDVSSTRAKTAPETPGPEVLGAGAEAVACSDFQRATISNALGGSGGAGGSFAGNGGGGGDANTDAIRFVGGLTNRAIDTSLLTTLRGGCRGQAGGGSDGYLNGGPAGAGGPPGGVVYLASLDTVQILPTGAIGANGGGGSGGGAQAGGGGGGSGGLIVLEAELKLIHLGAISANGGGGGEGGFYRTGDATAFVGDPGADGTIGAAAAPGGSATVSEGDGGPGAANGYGDATIGRNSVESGGGGGGGVGWIHVIAPELTGAGLASPPRE